MLYFGVAIQAKLRLAYGQQFYRREAWLLSVCRRSESYRAGDILSGGTGMRRMAVCATNVVAPMLAPPEIIVLFPACMTGKTSLRDCLGRFVLKRSHLRGITFFNVRLARPMARFTASHLSFPTANGGKLGMRSMRKGLELILMAIFARFATNVVPSLGGCILIRVGRLRSSTGGQPSENSEKQAAD